MAHYETSQSAITHSSEAPTIVLFSLDVNRHSSFYMLPRSGMIHCLLAFSFSVRNPWRALSEHWTAVHSPFHICYRIVPVGLLHFCFFGRSVYIYFFRRKVSARPYPASTSCLIPWIFSKTFFRLYQPIKTFRGRRGEIIREFLASAYSPCQLL